MDKSRHRGFTLMELMVTLALAGVLLGLAVPNMRSFMQNNRLAGVANDLLRSLNLARTEAIKRQTFVVVCASANPDAAEPSCGGQFQGWIVFEDTDADGDHGSSEPVIERHAFVDNSVKVNSDGNGIVSFARTGFAGFESGVALTQTANVMLCDRRYSTEGSSTDSTGGRALLITVTGRARVSRVKDEVDTAFSNISSAGCPS
jgi:type IV fimbrial biogenesis protein FimT